MSAFITNRSVPGPICGSCCATRIVGKLPPDYYTNPKSVYTYENARHYGFLWSFDKEIPEIANYSNFKVETKEGTIYYSICTTQGGGQQSNDLSTLNFCPKNPKSIQNYYVHEVTTFTRGIASVGCFITADYTEKYEQMSKPKLKGLEDLNKDHPLEALAHWRNVYWDNGLSKEDIINKLKSEVENHIAMGKCQIEVNEAFRHFIKKYKVHESVPFFNGNCPALKIPHLTFYVVEK
jgi:hypothetical protein